jgi:hypothetical protein
MNLQHRACSLAALVLSLVTLGLDAAVAQANTKEAVAGADTQLLESDQAIEAAVQPARGSLRIEEVTVGGEKRYRLIYRAYQAGTTDEVEYTIAGQPQKLAVSIRETGALAPEAYQEGFKALFVLFVLAVLIESALAIVFNWRPFVETFNARAVRPLVAVVVAYIFVEGFDLDIVTNLVNGATTAEHPSRPLGQILTAMIIAGGSAGVNSLFVALGYRERKTPETTAPKPPPTVGWIAVRLVSKPPEGSGSIDVCIGKPPAADKPPPVVGTIKHKSRAVVNYLLADKGRFPTYGGHAVAADSEVTIALMSGDETIKKWGPHTVAGGAIIDIDL